MLTKEIIEQVIAETVAETPDGAPSGVLYAALMPHGVTYDQYMDAVTALKHAGRIREEFDLLFAA